MAGVIFLCTFAGNVESAKADPITIDFSALSSAEKTVMESKVLHWTEIGVGDEPSLSPLRTGLIRAAEAGGVEPAVSTMGSLGPIAFSLAAGYTAYKITSALAGGFIYRKISGDDSNPSGVALAGRWQCYDTTGIVCSAGGSPAGFNTPIQTGAYTGVWWKFRINWFADELYCNGAYGSSGIAVCSSGDAPDAIALGNAATGTKETNVDGSSGACPAGAGTCAMKWRSDAEMQRHVTVHPMTATEYDDYTGPKHEIPDTTYTQPDHCDDTCLQDALDAINSNDPGSQDGPDAAAVAALAPTPPPEVPDCDGLSVDDCLSALEDAGLVGTIETLDPGGAILTRPAGAIVTTDPGAHVTVSPGATVTIHVNPDPLPIEVLNPLPNETYDDYLARLQERGYVGTVTVITVDPTLFDPTAGPLQPIRMRIPTIGITPGTTFPFGVPFPSPPPRIMPDTPTTVYQNPPDVPAVDPGGPGSSDCGPTIPPIDFTPFLAIDPTEKFPFGIFTFIGAALAPIVATPQIPDFEIPISLPGVGDGTIELDLTPLDPYMQTIRLLMSIGIAIAALWMLASSLLGFRAGSAGGGLEMGSSLDDD